MQGDEELLTFQRFMLAFDSPAYLRRARQVEAEWTHLVAHCERERGRLLEMPRLRLAQLIAATGAERHPERLPVDGGLRDSLLALHKEWLTALRAAVPSAPNAAAVAALLENVGDSFARFNRRWEMFLTGVDLTPVNRAREGYNRYYVLEKECAVRSERTALEGFEPLPMVSSDDLRELFPPLPQIDSEQAAVQNSV
ncbi:MAG: hypothetical protein KDA75_00755 [Planctomycetaceae bacterium]|nr:hypothetical protein [Planctomycetaceae bacterium]